MTIVGYHVISLGVFAVVTSDPIQKLEDPITTCVLDNIGLEHGTAAGLGIFALGAVGAFVLVVRWVAFRFAVYPLPCCRLPRLQRS